MTAVKKDSKNPFFKNNYASLDAILEAIKQPLADAKLAVVQFPINEGNMVGVRTILLEETSGEMLEDKFVMTLAKNDPQGAGSAITYSKRYALCAVLGIATEDDDGHSASMSGKQEASFKASGLTNHNSDKKSVPEYPGVAKKGDAQKLAEQLQAEDGEVINFN